MNERGEEQDLLLTWGGGSKREALWRGGGGVVSTPKRKRRDTGQASGEGGREAGEGMSKRLREMREGERGERIPELGLRLWEGRIPDIIVDGIVGRESGEEGQGEGAEEKKPAHGLGGELNAGQKMKLGLRPPESHQKPGFQKKKKTKVEKGVKEDRKIAKAGRRGVKKKE